MKLINDRTSVPDSVSTRLMFALVASCAAVTTYAQEVVTGEARELPRVDVIGTTRAQNDSPGSAAVIDGQTLEQSRVFNVNEALRKVPGIHVREEEGVGLRPNIGMRGLNPTRSTKTLLLEDGLPLSFAPYGDNASYYHPPIDRYESIEVSKGSQVIRFGPQTAGGVINYITPEPQREFGGFVGLAAGTRGYLNGHAMLTGNGVIADVYHKESDGARDNMHSRLDDLNVKWAGQLNDDNKLVLRATHFREHSQLTYAGLNQAEYENNPRQNPFRNDYFDANRTGLSATHEWRMDADSKLVTSLYGAYFDRDWWRQASQSTDCASRDVAAANGCAVNGRLRQYTTLGIDTRMFRRIEAFGVENRLEFGVKFHTEHQRRRQLQYASYDAFINDQRNPANYVQENQARKTEAWSVFVSDRVQLSERLVVTPIIRIERIRNQRLFYDDNNASTANAGSTTSSFTEIVPGMGATYSLDARNTLYGGVHSGFSPPRVEDAIAGAGTVVDLQAEKSINAEIGWRGTPTDSLSLDIAAFSNDFSNLVQVGSIAGGSTGYQQGKALFQGLELAAQLDKLARIDDGEVFSRVAWTWLPVADQRTAFSSKIDGNTVPGAVGNRLPYAPENLLNLTLGYRAAKNWNARVEYVYVGSQYSDFANTVTATTSGQQGLISAYSVWNMVMNYTLGPATIFIAGKNLADSTYIVDRTRGIQVGMPRTVQAGIKYVF